MDEDVKTLFHSIHVKRGLQMKSEISKFQLRICGTNMFRMTFLLAEDVSILEGILSPSKPREANDDHQPMMLVRGKKINGTPLRGAGITNIPDDIERLGFRMTRVFLNSHKTNEGMRKLSFMFERTGDADIQNGTGAQQRFFGWLIQQSWSFIAFRNDDGTVAMSCSERDLFEVEHEIRIAWKTGAEAVSKAA